MPTIYQNFVSGALTADPGIGGTSISASALTALVTVAAPDTMWVVLDPSGVNGAPEIVLLTAHAAAASTATVTRAQQGTTARAHPVGTVFHLAPTKSDLDELPFRRTTAKGDLLVGTGARAVTAQPVGADGLVLAALAAQPTGVQWAQVGTGGLADNAVTNAKLADNAVGTAELADNAVTTAKIANGAVSLADLAAEVLQQLNPAGTIRATVAATADPGWLLLDGQVVTNAQTLYPALWAAIPASWKSGANATLADARGRTLFMDDAAGDFTLGAVGGSNVSIGAHPHFHPMDHGHTGIVASTTNTGAHNHVPATSGRSFVTVGSGTVNFATTAGSFNIGVDGGTSSETHSHNITNGQAPLTSGLTTGTNPGPSAVDQRNAHLTVNFQIKAH
jgi:hypothetical protein